jgi:hypothetical protein
MAQGYFLPRSALNPYCRPNTAQPSSRTLRGVAANKRIAICRRTSQPEPLSAWRRPAGGAWNVILGALAGIEVGHAAAVGASSMRFLIC